ncbi:aldehyde dehydrogenase family protein [Gemelliphila asaccharolytica]|uniref:Aldehyde dehydrogenase B n=1 Tax=Gemelliphila asaccharolytica TaxID=502393 RepID=A0ABR5TN72_9BACL|nr:aldehyde dehydrogenase family protein [Gemella asaccharolytica]KXB58858.1 putative aldehyde dehydrogenase B [Gemella asaccharolytica]
MKKVNLKKQYGLFIDGEWKNSSDGEVFKSYSPATGEMLAEISEATKEDVDSAVKAARKALPEWAKTSPIERQNLLLKIADIIDANTEHLAMVETLDNGKPIRETATVDIPMSSDHFRYFAGVIRAEEGTATMLDDNTMSLVVKEPIGVVGQIIPWNFPFLMAAWKIAPALAAGNTIVLKPSSHTSLSLLELVELIKDVLPKGVLNVVTGAGSKSGQYLLEHNGIDKLAFTGSTKVGYNVYKAACEKLIPATLELGGKSANMIFDDCDIDQAVEGVQIGILFNQGQVCCAGSRVFVQEGIYDEFLKRLKKAFEMVKIGNPLDMNTQLGSAIYEKQMEKVLSYIKVGQDEGCKLITGGERYTENGCEKGFFVKPTILTASSNNERVCREEIFGPVVVVQKFKTADEVIKLANDSEYGLGGGVFTTNLNTAMKVSRGVHTGRVWVNTYNDIPAGAPFGGYKRSGIGRETHKVIMNAYSQTKNIIINLNEGTKGLYDVK